MPPTKQDFGGLLARFVDSEGGHTLRRDKALATTFRSERLD